MTLNSFFYFLQSGEDAVLVEARVCVNKKFKLIDCPTETAEFRLFSSRQRSFAWTAPCPNSFVFPQ